MMSQNISGLLFASIGWAGVIFYVFAHIYLTVHWRYRHQIYLIINLIAALCVLTSSAVISSWQPVFTNGFWAVVSLVALARGGTSGLKLLLKFPLLALLATLGCATAAAYALGWPYGAAALGWVGVALYSVSYLQFTGGALSKVGYLLWNCAAAISLIPQLWLVRDIPAFGMQVIWLVLSIVGALRAARAVPVLERDYADP